MSKVTVRGIGPNDSIKTDHTVVMVKASWCGACKKAAPQYEEQASRLAKKGSKVSFYFVDAEKVKDSPSKMVRKLIRDTGSYPTFYFIKNDEVISKMGGFSKDKFVVKVSEIG
jgi:thiol-disulfide isomerase/thioredoxin